MNLEYFKHQIYDELCGAEEYIRHAIEIKAMESNWGALLVDMSSAELKHATNLYNMAQEYYVKMTSKYTVIPEYIKQMWEDLTKYYTEMTAKIKYIHDMYNK